MQTIIGIDYLTVTENRCNYHSFIDYNCLMIHFLWELPVLDVLFTIT